MASFMNYFGARRDGKQAARDAIVTLRQQLQMIEKKEEYLQKKIDEELKKAKANAVSNKAGKALAPCERGSVYFVEESLIRNDDRTVDVKVRIPRLIELS